MNNQFPFEGILLVSDMDRTLITENFVVPKRNKEAIDRFVGKGGRFSLATGRGAPSAVKYIADLTINAPSILTNGSSIYDFSKKEILWNASLPKEALALAQTVIARFPDVGVEIYSDEKIYIANENEWTKRHITNESFEFCYSSPEAIPKGYQKVLLADNNERLCEVDKYLRSAKICECDLVFSNPMYYEVIPKGISKGSSLLKLAGLLGIKKENTVGIGDYYNDEALVKMAGFGATVAGAPKELCDAAKFITGPCSGGAVADLIEYMEKTPELFNN